MRDNNCSFCNHDEIQRQIIYEDKLLRIVYPRRPVFNYHLMIVPVEHFETFDQLSDDVAAALPKLVGRVKQAFSNDTFLGYNIFSNNGDESIGQSVPHFHLHMFIRYSDEEVSPYKLMNQSERKQLTEKQWMENLELFKTKLAR